MTARWSVEERELVATESRLPSRRRCLLVPRLVLALAIPAFVIQGCAGARPRGEVALLRVIAQPATARVELEEAFFAPARALAEQPAELTPGLHLITVRAAGHFPHDLELDLPPGLTTIEVSLRPIPDWSGSALDEPPP